MEYAMKAHGRRRRRRRRIRLKWRRMIRMRRWRRSMGSRRRELIYCELAYIADVGG